MNSNKESFPKNTSIDDPTDGPSVDCLRKSRLSIFFCFQIAPSLILSTNQHHGPSIHLCSVDGSRRSILSYSSTSGTGTFSNLIDDLTGRSVDQLMDRRYFHSPTFCQNSPCFLQIPEPSTDGHHLQSVNKTTGRRWPSWVTSVLNLHNLL